MFLTSVGPAGTKKCHSSRWLAPNPPCRHARWAGCLQAPCKVKSVGGFAPRFKSQHAVRRLATQENIRNFPQREKLTGGADRRVARWRGTALAAPSLYCADRASRLSGGAATSRVNCAVPRAASAAPTIFGRFARYPANQPYMATLKARGQVELVHSYGRVRYALLFSACSRLD